MKLPIQEVCVKYFCIFFIINLRKKLQKNVCNNNYLGLSIANLLIGKLDGCPGKSYLISCKELVVINYELSVNL